MKLKIDMSAAAIAKRLEQVEQLRRRCLALADSSVGREIRARCKDNPTVQRTDRAIGH